MDRNAYVKALWAAKLARTITPHAYLIGRVLLRRADRAWRCWPSLDTLGRDVGCCARTAARAVQALRRAGLLSWVERRAAWNRRASNLYVLGLPERKEGALSPSRAPMSYGSSAPLTPDMAAALVRLGAALGCSPGEAMPWLAVPRPG